MCGYPFSCLDVASCSFHIATLCQLAVSAAACRLTILLAVSRLQTAASTVPFHEAAAAEASDVDERQATADLEAQLMATEAASTAAAAVLRDREDRQRRISQHRRRLLLGGTPLMPLAFALSSAGVAGGETHTDEQATEPMPETEVIYADEMAPSDDGSATGEVHSAHADAGQRAHTAEEGEQSSVAALDPSAQQVTFEASVSEAYTFRQDQLTNASLCNAAVKSRNAAAYLRGCHGQHSLTSVRQDIGPDVQAPTYEMLLGIASNPEDNVDAGQSQPSKYALMSFSSLRPIDDLLTVKTLDVTEYVPLPPFLLNPSSRTQIILFYRKS